MGLLTRFSQEEPFDLSQKPPGLPSLRLSQSDGESVPGSSCQEEDEESLYRRSQYSPEVEERGQGSPADRREGEKQKEMYQQRESAGEGGDQVHLEETSEMESDLELDDHETGRGQSYDYDSDSELEELDEAEQRFSDTAERNQSRSDTGEISEFVGVTAPQEEELDDE